MDPPPRASSHASTPHPRRSSSHRDSWEPSAPSSDEQHSSNGGRTPGMIRRGHSDGDVLNASPIARPMGRESASGDRETWVDFLRQSSDTGFDHGERSSIAARRERAALMAADRRRRLSGLGEEHPRRTSSASLPIGQLGHHRARQSFTNSTSDRPLFGPANSTGNPFPPRITDRPLPRRPSEEHLPNRRSREIALPRWQPDAEVSACPICQTTFSFWYRKHHCRKCGRVVCANCSPHRITIPRQFIVHPPDEAVSSPAKSNNPGIEVVDLTGDEPAEPGPHAGERPQSSDYKIDPALGGGQEVRLCNPCVPDPNPLPHLPYGPHSQNMFASFPGPVGAPSDHQLPSPQNRTASAAHRTPTVIGRTSSGHYQYRPSNAAAFDASVAPSAMTPSAAGVISNRRHSHVARASNSPMTPSSLSTLYGSAPDQTSQQRYLDLLQAHRSAQHRHRHRASMGTMSNPSRYHTSPGNEIQLPRPIPQPRQLREEDECPICHDALPPKDIDGSETAREEHVTACIESHFSSSTPRASHPPATVAISAAVAASGATPSQAAGPIDISPQHRNSGASNDAPSASFQQRRRITGMVVYHATEKDCVGEDGEGEAECVICFEEFEVGDEMGRLECLCKFHKRCIRQWWDTKGPGACPVHQEG